MDDRNGGFYPTPEPSIETQNDIVVELLDALPPFGDPAPLTLTSLLSSKLPVIEIQDKQWLAYFQSQTTAVYRDGQLDMPVISLEEAVLVLYRLSVMDGIRIPKKHVDAALAEIKRRLLLFAIDRRNKGDMRGYFAVLPLVSIGEFIGLRLNHNDHTGVLRGWDSKKEHMWLCILHGKRETKTFFNWEELEESHIVLSGAMGKLHRKLLKIEK